MSSVSAPLKIFLIFKPAPKENPMVCILLWLTSTSKVNWFFLSGCRTIFAVRDVSFSFSTNEILENVGKMLQSKEQFGIKGPVMLTLKWIKNYFNVAKANKDDVLI